MSERKVLNKYYPPDFDPSKIPRMKLAKNRQYTVRLMAPFNMRCITCGEYIYKGKKFNARKEDVENETYLGIRIYRFYIKCTRCLQEISFKTDPKNTDYEIEAGATRNFMALKLAEEQARKEEEELREEELNNPMKLLENRTQQSRNEIELLESLEELRDLNRRHQSVDYDKMLEQFDNTETERQRAERQERMDEEFVKSIKFVNGAKDKKNQKIVSEEIVEEVDEPLAKNGKFKVPGPVSAGVTSSINATGDVLNTTVMFTANVNKDSNCVRVGGLSRTRNSLKNLVKRKTPVTTSATITASVDSALKDTDEKIENSPKVPEKIQPNSSVQSQVSGGGLQLLAAYSDSSDNDSN